MCISLTYSLSLSLLLYLNFFVVVFVFMCLLNITSDLFLYSYVIHIYIRWWLWCHFNQSVLWLTHQMTSFISCHSIFICASIFGKNLIHFAPFPAILPSLSLILSLVLSVYNTDNICIPTLLGLLFFAQNFCYRVDFHFFFFFLLSLTLSPRLPVKYSNMLCNFCLTRFTLPYHHFIVVRDAT